MSRWISTIKVSKKVAGGALFKMKGQRLTTDFSERSIRVNLTPWGALSSAFKSWTSFSLFHLENFVLARFKTSVIHLFHKRLKLITRHLFEPGVGWRNIQQDFSVSLFLLSFSRLTLKLERQGTQTNFFCHLSLSIGMKLIHYNINAIFDLNTSNSHSYSI